MEIPVFNWGLKFIDKNLQMVLSSIQFISSCTFQLQKIKNLDKMLLQHPFLPEWFSNAL